MLRGRGKLVNGGNGGPKRTEFHTRPSLRKAHRPNTPELQRVKSRSPPLIARTARSETRRHCYTLAILCGLLPETKNLSVEAVSPASELDEERADVPSEYRKLLPSTATVPLSD